MTSSGARVLVVDDAQEIRTIVRKTLERDGYVVETACEADEALLKLRRNGPAVVVLDVMMPGRGGLDVLRDVRRVSGVPVILLTSRDTEADRVVGLELGADDYVVKPFFPRELSARVAAVLRRSSDKARSGRVGSDEISVDLDARIAMVGGDPVDLTPRELDLLARLMASRGKVVSREKLLREVWGSRWQDEATVTEHVRRVRQKIDVGRDRSFIATVRGVGYRFDG